MAVLGKTVAERHDTIYQGGLTIKTTLTPKMQKAAHQKYITKAVPIHNKSNLGGGVTIIQPGTGKILAMAQGSDFAKNQVNWNVDVQYGGLGWGWQFGSTAKMFALVDRPGRGLPLNASVPVPAAGRSEHPLRLPGQRVPRLLQCTDKFEVRNDFSNGPNRRPSRWRTSRRSRSTRRSPS